jgi:DNA-binding NarL/FixJ family response regulator
LLLGAAATVLRDSIGEPFSAAWRARFESWLTPARQALSVEEADAAWAEGRAMNTEQSVNEAMRPDGLAERPVTTHAAVATTPTTVAASTSSTVARVAPSGTIVVAPPPPPAPIPAPAPVAASRPAVAVHQTPLTQREREVAGLIARGMSNRQIATELVITEGTAANHVKHILARLVLDSRVQIATWAIERDLHRVASA